MENIIKRYWYLIITVLFLIAIIFVIGYKSIVQLQTENFDDKIEMEKIELNSETSVEVDNYYVDIKGEVVKPGVYEANPNSRIIDIIKLAGGLTKNADTSLINLSKKISDEMNIKIYSKKEVRNAKDNLSKEPEVIEIIKEIEKECICPDNNEVCSDNSNKNGALIEDSENQNIDSNKDDNKLLININTATKEELLGIPDIGESKANKIIEYRNNNKFEKIEDIQNVSGIGETIFEKIKNYITV